MINLWIIIESLMPKFLKIFTMSFLVVGFINQIFYNFCFSDRCLSAAFPKVLLLSLIVSAVIFMVTKDAPKTD